MNELTAKILPFVLHQKMSDLNYMLKHYCPSTLYLSNNYPLCCVALQPHGARIMLTFVLKIIVLNWQCQHAVQYILYRAITVWSFGDIKFIFLIPKTELPLVLSFSAAQSSILNRTISKILKNEKPDRKVSGR